MQKISELETNWVNPPAMYRPFVRWWWFGGGLSKAEITHEITEMAQNGFGGAEIQPIYSALKGHPISNFHETQWLSAEWVDLVQHAVNEGKRLGIQIDFTFGNGWPFGGPYITKDLASTKLSYFSDPLMNGKELELNLGDLVEKPDQMVGVFALNIISETNLIKDQVDLKEKTDNSNTVHWNVPSEGQWILVWFYYEPTQQKVKRATPGGEGLVLDHLNRNAFDLHANKINTALQQQFRDKLGNQFGAFFCDSWEVFGENWTPSFLSTFKNQFNYDLCPYLPILQLDQWPKYQKSSPEREYGIRYDYHKCHADLILDNFFKPFSDFCHQVGVQCRVEPYSAPTDLLAAYGLLDICEMEGFGTKGINTMYYGKIDPRLASSGAHIYGKPLVSCESFTWLGEHFSVPLAKIKEEADQIILNGINRIIYHGFSYSPPEAGVPGWVFYAANLVNRNNTWWPFIEELNKYITRNAYLSNLGRNVADFAVYLPIHDEWSGKEDILKDLRVRLKENGHFTDFDYVNDERLWNSARIEANKLHIGTGQYIALILYNTEYLPIKTANKIRQLITEGLTVIFIGDIPIKSPGLNALSNGDSTKVQEIFAEIRKNIKHSYPNVYFLNNFIELPKIFGEINFLPDFAAVNEKGEPAPVRYLHRHLDDGDLYFVVNHCSETIQMHATFRSLGKVQILENLRKKMESISSIPLSPNQTEMEFSLGALESRWFLFDRSQIEKNKTQTLIQEKISTRPITSIPITNSWSIRFLWPENVFPIETPHETLKKNITLFDWRTDPELQYFSGTAIYQTEFQIEKSLLQPNQTIILDIGILHNMAEITVNQLFLGKIWWLTHQIDITKAVHEGTNHLEIQVTNLLLNKIIGFEQKGQKWKPDYYFVDINYKEFKPKPTNLLPSGLIGPVSVILKQT